MYAITNSPIRAVVVNHQSKIGYSYPEMWVEDCSKGWEKRDYYIVDLYLTRVSRLCTEKEFEEIFNEAEPQTIQWLEEDFGWKKGANFLYI